MWRLGVGVVDTVEYGGAWAGHGDCVDRSEPVGLGGVARDGCGFGRLASAEGSGVRACHCASAITGTLSSGRDGTEGPRSDAER
jgi:hypothetical protein